MKTLGPRFPWRSPFPGDGITWSLGWVTGGIVVVVVGATVVLVVRRVVLGAGGTEDPLGPAAVPDVCCELATAAYVPAAPATITTTATDVTTARRLQLPRRYARRVARSVPSDASSELVSSASTGLRGYWTIPRGTCRAAFRGNALSARARSRIRSTRRARHRTRQHCAGRGGSPRPPRS